MNKIKQDIANRILTLDTLIKRKEQAVIKHKNRDASIDAFFKSLWLRDEQIKLIDALDILVNDK